MQSAALRGLFAALRKIDAEIETLSEAYMKAPIGEDLELKVPLDNAIVKRTAIVESICALPVQTFGDAAAKLEFSFDFCAPERQEAIASVLEYLRARVVHAA